MSITVHDPFGWKKNDIVSLYYSNYNNLVKIYLKVGVTDWFTF